MQNSKINTILLAVVIILLGVGLWMINQNKTSDIGLEATQSPSDLNQTTNNNTDFTPNDTANTGMETGAVTLNLSNPNVGVYTMLFTKEFDEPANYAGHFRLVAPGCGSNCFTLFALDKNTGETYKIGSDWQYDADYRVRGNEITLVSKGGVVSTYTFNEKTQKFESVTVLPMITGDTKNLVSFSIAPGATVSGKITATGSIKGGYFSEANMGVNILDANKATLKQGNGTATSNWMTSDPVSFTTKLDFTGIPAGSGYIRIKNSNPSGDPINDKYIDIPVVFK